MPFGEVTALYLPPAPGSASLWGTNVRPVTSTVVTQGTADTPNTTVNHGTGGVVVRTVNPFAASTADAAQTDFGFAVAPTDMGSVTGAKRFYRAGNHTATASLAHNGIAAETATMFMYVYRVGSAAGGRTRTLLGSNSAALPYPINNGTVTMSLTVALPEIIFEPDETIQYSFEHSMSGIVGTGHFARFYLGYPNNGVPARVDTPALGTLAQTTGTATSSSSASGVTAKVLATAGTATGSSTASGVAGATKSTTGTATGSSTATGAGAKVATTTGSAAGSSTATGQTAKVLGTVGTATVGGGGTGPGTTVYRPIWIED